MNKGRTYNSIKNFIYGSFSQILSLVLSFGVRTVFIQYLSIVYLGLNGLFTNILTLLSLAELGFGVAMVHALYKPLAEDNKEKLIAYMQFYARTYKIIGFVVAFIGCTLIPFLDKLIKGDCPADVNVTLIYILFLSESVASYFFAYKRSILNADQKAYICSSVHLEAIVLRSLLQIVVIVVFKAFIVYIVIQILTTIGENLYLSYKVNKLYPYLCTKQKFQLNKDELNSIRHNVYALILSRIAAISLKGTSNIVISAFVGLAIVGLYSNYLMIIGAVSMILSQVFSAMTGSVGNYIAKEHPSKYLALFERLDFLNFWLYGLTAVCLFLFLNPFITIWIGKEFVLEQSTVLIIVVNFLLEGLLYTLWLFRTTVGLFTQGKYRPILAAAINIVFSIFLGKYFGINGVLLGTTIARLCVNAWYDPYIIYKFGLHSPVQKYFKSYIFRVFLLCVISIVSYHLKGVYDLIDSFSSFFIIAIVYFLILNVIFSLLYRKNINFAYYKSFVFSMLKK